MISKIIYRAYRISHLRNVALLQGGTFAVGLLNYEFPHAKLTLFINPSTMNA